VARRKICIDVMMRNGVLVSALLWWLIPVGAVIIALGIGALVSYFRRPTEHHDLGKFVSMQEAMNRSHGHIRVQRNPDDRD